MNRPVISSKDAVKAEFWSSGDDGKLHCHLCPRGCRLKDGQRAFCFVREARDGELLFTSYGRSTGYCLDPIEKKPLNHFLPGSAVFSFGTAGCNLGCRYCQNWESSKARATERASATASPEQIAAAAKKYGARSVAFTYNDPVVFLEYVVDTAKACKDRDLHTVAVTAGYITDAARERFFAEIDAVNIDLKGATDGFYHKLCAGHLDPVLRTIDYLQQRDDIWFEITTLVIPGHNDDEAHLNALAELVVTHAGPNTPLHFSAFHPDFKMRDVPPCPPDTLRKARQIAMDYGLKYVYTGNIHDTGSQSTYCPRCSSLLIERNWYQLGAFNIRDGRCRSCGQEINGVFEDHPGSWGARRQPVRV